MDFDGTEFSKELESLYGFQFLNVSQQDLPALLAWYSDDVTSLVEREIALIEDSIRKAFPEAKFIGNHYHRCVLESMLTFFCRRN